MKNRYFLKVFNCFQMILDFSLVFASFYLGTLIYNFVNRVWGIGTVTQDFLNYRSLALGAGVLFLVLFERFGLYSRKVGLLNVEEMKRLLQSILIGSLILFSISFFLRPLMFTPSSPLGMPSFVESDIQAIFAKGPLLYSRLILLYSLITLLILVKFERYLSNRFLLYFHMNGPGLHRVLIYGTSDLGRQMARRLLENPRLGIKPVGFIVDDIDQAGQEIHLAVGQHRTSLMVVGAGADIPELIQTWNVDELIIAMPNANNARIYEIITSCVTSEIRYSFVPNLYELFIQQVRFEEIEGIPLLRMKEKRISYIFLAVKRLFDIVVASAALLVTAPIGLIIVSMIKIDSKGKSIFAQQRVGKDGKLFTMYKFRSMLSDIDHYDSSPRQDTDPRITRLGKMLRRFSLDEIPQLINVLKGDMSLVGPRPEMPFVVDNYTPIQRQRLKVRPGITGIWQISSARNDEIHENLDYDFYYTENQSFLLDLVIIWKTISSTLFGRGV